MGTLSEKLKNIFAEKVGSSEFITRREAIKQTRAEIAENVALSIKLKKEIESLRWVFGTTSKRVHIMSIRDEDTGFKVYGRRATRPYRRVDTGWNRSQLKMRRRNIGARTRIDLMMLAYLTGRPVLSVERYPLSENCKYSYTYIEHRMEKMKFEYDKTHLKNWCECGEALSW
jgi:hypothetical protein